MQNKLDRLRFAHLIAHCVSNGMSPGEYEVERIDELTTFEVDEKPNNFVSEESVNDLLKAMALNEKIPAIKAYRVLTGAGLSESKEAVEKYWVSNNMLDAKTLKQYMIDSLDKPACIIDDANKQQVRDFIESFSDRK